ncbi:MAG TPA: extracellular solute-binding protein [Tepidisphaeraceae bacterium]|nr:extracellular solute-binding protein [Tepidisphaeraceae bacterium]
MRTARQSWLWLVAAAVLGILTAGCEPKRSEPIRQIRSLHSSGVYAEAARELAAEFERETGIHVTILEANLLSLREKELTDVLTRGGNYDVLQVAYQWEGEILPHLRPLDDVVAGIDLQDFIPTVRNNCGRWGERVYGLPMACDVITLLYRTDVFAERSAEFEKLRGRPLTPPGTWQEYLEIAEFLHSDTLCGNILMGREQSYTVWSGILHGVGGRTVDDQWRPTLNSEAGVQSLSMLVQMYKYAPLHSEGRSVMEANDLFLHGRGAMYMTWPSLIWSQLTDTNRCPIAGRIGAAVIPGGKPQLSSWSLGINSACKDVDAASQWIQFFVSPSNTKRLLLKYGKGSPRISTYQDPECRQRIFYHSQLLEGLAGNQSRFRIPPSQELSDYLDNQLLKAIRGQTTPRAALDRTAAKWREILTQTGFLRENAGNDASASLRQPVRAEQNTADETYEQTGTQP